MILLFILFAAGIAGSILFFSWKYGISPTPTSPRVAQKLLEVLPNLHSGKIAEFGSGWGTLAFALARQFPQSEIIAIEISPGSLLLQLAGLQMASLSQSTPTEA